MKSFERIIREHAKERAREMAKRKIDAINEQAAGYARHFASVTEVEDR